MTAILFGSIGTLADTSELQREAFNRAFAEHGLDWSWSQDEYRRLLEKSGGAQRIAEYAEARGEQVDARAIHASKSRIFQETLRRQGASIRPDIAGTIEAARARGAKIALVTTTEAENVAALRDALEGQVDLDAFDLVLNTGDVSEVKPAPEVYHLALERLGESPDTVVAVEDNAGGVVAADSAGIPVVAFPGVNNADHDFSAAERTVSELSPEDLTILGGGR